MLLILSEVLSAILDTSPATTTKPLPASPARAASMDALSAKSSSESLISVINAPISFISCIREEKSRSICSLSASFSDTEFMFFSHLMIDSRPDEQSFTVSLSLSPISFADSSIAVILVALSSTSAKLDLTVSSCSSTFSTTTERLSAILRLPILFLSALSFMISIASDSITTFSFVASKKVCILFLTELTASANTFWVGTLRSATSISSKSMHRSLSNCAFFINLPVYLLALNKSHNNTPITRVSSMIIIKNNSFKSMYSPPTF